MIRSTARLLVVVALARAGDVPLLAQTSGAPTAPDGPCARVVDGTGLPLSTAIAWTMRSKPRERGHLDRHCNSLGSIVLVSKPTTAPPAVIDTLTIVGWNVHVGGGDVVALLDRLESGDLTGTPASHYVLLLEEAYRAGGDVPPVPAGVSTPRRIRPHTDGRLREDIVSVAHRRGLALYYVPSMRNGREPPFEDRGNAILSTFPLDDLAAIELPFTRQRRIAIAARIRGSDCHGAQWSLRLVAVHLDPLAGPSRLWIFAAGWRGGQARAVIDALHQEEPSALGGDLNTWLLGRWESAWRRIARSYPDTRRTATPRGASPHGRLDYLFYRLPLAWTSGVRKLPSKWGSDHAPLVGTIRFEAPRPAADTVSSPETGERISVRQLVRCRA